MMLFFSELLPIDSMLLHRTGILVQINDVAFSCTEIRTEISTVSKHLSKLDLLAHAWADRSDSPNAVAGVSTTSGTSGYETLTRNNKKSFKKSKQRDCKNTKRNNLDPQFSPEEIKSAWSTGSNSNIASSVPSALPKKVPSTSAERICLPLVICKHNSTDNWQKKVNQVQSRSLLLELGIPWNCRRLLTKHQLPQSISDFCRDTNGMPTYCLRGCHWSCLAYQAAQYQGTGPSDLGNSSPALSYIYIYIYKSMIGLRERVMFQATRLVMLRNFVQFDSRNSAGQSLPGGAATTIDTECNDSNHQTLLNTWWLIPLSKWVITPVISGLTLLIPFITGVTTHLLSGMSHQVLICFTCWPCFLLSEKLRQNIWQNQAITLTYTKLI